MAVDRPGHRPGPLAGRPRDALPDPSPVAAAGRPPSDVPARHFEHDPALRFAVAMDPAPPPDPDALPLQPAEQRRRHAQLQPHRHRAHPVRRWRALAVRVLDGRLRRRPVRALPGRDQRPDHVRRRPLPAGHGQERRPGHGRGRAGSSSTSTSPSSRRARSIRAGRARWRRRRTAWTGPSRPASAWPEAGELARADPSASPAPGRHRHRDHRGRLVPGHLSRDHARLRPGPGHARAHDRAPPGPHHEALPADSPERTWVIELDGLVQGYAITEPGSDQFLPPPDGAGEVESLYLHPEAIGRGLGRPLLDHAVADLWARASIRSCSGRSRPTAGPDASTSTPAGCWTSPASTGSWTRSRAPSSATGWNPRGPDARRRAPCAAAPLCAAPHGRPRERGSPSLGTKVRAHGGTDGGTPADVTGG